MSGGSVALPLLGGLGRHDRHELPAALAGAEADGARRFGVERMVAADPDIGAGMPLGAAPTHDDVAGFHGFAPKHLTPRRRPAVSRPLRDEPPAFL